MKKLFLLTAALLAVSAWGAASPAPSCKGSSQVVGECFRFRGRLGMYNGGHTFWIWWVGTNHRYWVEDSIPAGLEQQQLDWAHFYWGEFDACPVTKFEKGHAQGICLKSVGKLITTKRSD